MKIFSVKVLGYKSVQEETTLYLRDSTTCFIGANEHGKTNLLNAIHKIGEQNLNIEDANSVLRNNGIAEIPKIVFELRLEKHDRQRITEVIASLTPADAPTDEDSKKCLELYQLILTDITKSEDVFFKLTVDTSGRHYSFVNTYDLSSISPDLVNSIEQLLPKSYLFSPSNQISDTVTLEEITQKRSIEFEGLIKLSGFWEKREQLFLDGPNAAGLRTQASRALTKEVKKLWSQGKSDYNFILNLESGPRLSLTIEDNTGNFDSPSNRSLGFRAFFSFYLAIYAQTSTLNPTGYVFLFDEPEIHLHPEAQKDLLRELRKLSSKNQIVFATHSPFMIDKNNLMSTVVIKKQTFEDKPKGTKVIHKAYLNNWLAVRESLGVLMGDTLLYTHKSLFVEGTSDRLLVTAILENFKNELAIDMNYLSILDGDQKREALGVARILLSEDRHLVLMVDGDEGGGALTKQYEQLSKDLQKEDNIQLLNLKNVTAAKKPVSIEDMLPISIFVEGLNKYVKEIFNHDPIDNLETELKEKEKDRTRGRAFVEILSTKLNVAEDKIAKTTVADFFGQVLATKENVVFPDSAKNLATHLRSSLNLE